MLELRFRKPVRNTHERYFIAELRTYEKVLCFKLTWKNSRTYFEASRSTRQVLIFDSYGLLRRFTMGHDVNYVTFLQESYQVPTTVNQLTSRL